jgi:hypothetical protein
MGAEMKLKFWKSNDEKIKEAVQKITRAKPINAQDLDLARLEKMSMMVQRMQGQQQPQGGSNNFMNQMMQFEQFKSGMLEIENAKIDKLREQFESEAGDSDGGLNPDQIMNILGGVMQPQEPPKDAMGRVVTPPPPMQVITFPEKTETIIEKPLPELNALERNAVNTVVKKIPKTAKTLFKTLSEEKKDAILSGILDGIEQE